MGEVADGLPGVVYVAFFGGGAADSDAQDEPRWTGEDGRGDIELPGGVGGFGEAFVAGVGGGGRFAGARSEAEAHKIE